MRFKQISNKKQNDLYIYSFSLHNQTHLKMVETSIVYALIFIKNKKQNPLFIFNFSNKYITVNFSPSSTKKKTKVDSFDSSTQTNHSSHISFDLIDLINNNNNNKKTTNLCLITISKITTPAYLKAAVCIVKVNLLVCS